MVRSSFVIGGSPVTRSMIARRFWAIVAWLAGEASVSVGAPVLQGGQLSIDDRAGIIQLRRHDSGDAAHQRAEAGGDEGITGSE